MLRIRVLLVGPHVNVGGQIGTRALSGNASPRLRHAVSLVGPHGNDGGQIGVNASWRMFVKSEAEVRAFPFPNPAMAAIKITSSNILTLICSPFEAIFRIETCKLTGKPLLFNIWYKSSISPVWFLPAFNGKANPDGVRGRGKSEFRPFGHGWLGRARRLWTRSIRPGSSFGFRRGFFHTPPPDGLDRALPPWGTDLRQIRGFYRQKPRGKTGLNSDFGLSFVRSGRIVSFYSFCGKRGA
jgi:hypothetical protein